MFESAIFRRNTSVLNKAQWADGHPESGGEDDSDSDGCSGNDRYCYTPRSLSSSERIAELAPLVNSDDGGTRMVPRPPTLVRTQPIDMHEFATDNRYIITSDSDVTIKNGARTVQNHRSVKEQNFFTWKLNELDSIRATSDIFPLRRVTIKDRLDIFGHSQEDGQRFESAAPECVAKQLCDAGLREVGVIKFQSCLLGKHDFIEQLRDALIANGVSVGYVCAPTGNQRDGRIAVSAFGKKFNVRPFFFLPKKLVGALPEKFGLRVVKGNANVTFTGTRYM